ncbi:NAD(P)/FAD-dependent oxidoreductase [Zhihengliuella flava]|uniref:Glycine/D-amino acid oxidase-like deaminating enzyme n=1 Tax=Zhihengliuella flava TaxID=1285193 RepID=A0A931D7Y8_9MICC|nr:FAD-binding oxidoreductase [Zhihengliuella flava]MBG6084082.1 glycine/D-amino acid oxidase-like deaminating enzyme [Zhihengliuella flava]
MTNKVQTAVVLGGGVIGVSAATHLARAGVQVTLVTDAEPASGASGRSLSWLNSAGERSKPYHDLRMAGIDRYRTLYAQDPTRDWLQFDGAVYWPAAEDAAAAKERHAYELRHGYDSRYVTADNVRELTTDVDPQAMVADGVYNPGEGWVSLPHLIEFLLEGFTAAGGTLVTGAGQCHVVVDGGRATGVRAADGTVYAGEAVVVACGPQTPQVIAPLGVQIGDASPVSMVVISEPLTSPVTTVMNTPRAAIRPNPGGAVAVDHDWYEESIIESEDGYEIPEGVVDELMEEAARLLDGVEELPKASWKIGRKPIPGDGEPVFGELEAVPGCYAAFTHSGATLGLLAGELITYEVTAGQKHPMLETFRPERFG